MKAVEFGSLGCLKVLIELGGNTIRKQGFAKMTPLCLAAQNDFYECSEYLLDHKARVNSYDKFGRSPLALAVRNGHTMLASLLLQRGADWNQLDSSGNSPLHYAAGFGWSDCVSLLLHAGADLNASNDWKITPINLAMMKNRRACVNILLSQPGIEVNHKDDEGRSLLSLLMLQIDSQTESLIEQVLKLGADPNIRDFNDNTALHHLASFYTRNKASIDGNNSKKLLTLEQIGRIGKQLVDTGMADLSLKNNQKQTIFDIAIASQQYRLIEALIPQLSFKKNPELLFSFKPNMLVQQLYIDFIKQILNNDGKSTEALNKTDKDMMTPILKFSQGFSSACQDLANRLS